MIRIAYAGSTAPSAKAIAEASEGRIVAARTREGDLNWGRSDVGGTSMINADVSNATNKRDMRVLFKENGVPAPRLFLGEEADDAIASGVSLIGRPDRHRKGRGFWRIESATDLHAARQGTRRKRAATHFMEFIDTPREFRVHVFNQKIIRLNHKNTTAFHEWTSEPSPFSENDHIRQAAKAAMNSLGLTFGAVDILADESQAWALEVNTAPGLGGTLPQVYARHIIAHFPDLIEQDDAA